MKFGIKDTAEVTLYDRGTREIIHFGESMILSDLNITLPSPVKNSYDLKSFCEDSLASSKREYESLDSYKTENKDVETLIAFRKLELLLDIEMYEELG